MMKIEDLGFAVPLLSFDVESIGLHGEGYAVGYVVIFGGKEVEARYFACAPRLADGFESDREWVANNIPEIVSESPDPFTVREKFWRVWMHWKAQGAVLAADCGWPVEGRFLNRCVDALSKERAFAGPYPFLEISSVLWARGIDPMANYDRLPNELPKHDPVCDARQSARLLLHAIHLGPPN